MVMRYRRYRRRRPTRKRKTVKRRTRTSSTRAPFLTRVTKAPTSPLGKFFKMNLPYVERSILINPAIGGLAASYYFSANGLYDPNITGGGHQPLGFDQIMPMYDHYTVIASKITCTFYNDDTSIKQVVGLRLADSTTLTSADPTALMESGGGKYGWLNARAVDGDMATMTLGCSPKKFFSKSLNDDVYKGGIGSNPSDQVYFHIWCAPFNSADSAAVYVNVRIDYIALFSEPKQLAQS